MLVNQIILLLGIPSSKNQVVASCSKQRRNSGKLLCSSIKIYYVQNGHVFLMVVLLGTRL